MNHFISQWLAIKCCVKKKTWFVLPFVFCLMWFFIHGSFYIFFACIEFNGFCKLFIRCIILNDCFLHRWFYVWFFFCNRPFTMQIYQIILISCVRINRFISSFHERYYHLNACLLHINYYYSVALHDLDTWLQEFIILYTEWMTLIYAFDVDLITQFHTNWRCNQLF